MASPIVTINGGASPQNVSAASTVTIALASVAGVNSWSLACLSTDETITPAAVNASVVVNNTSKTATFTAPALGTAMLFQSQVNGGLNSNGLPDSTQSATFGVFVPAANGNTVLALGMTFEPSATNGWLAPFNKVARSAGGSSILGSRYTMEQYDANAGSSSSYNCTAALQSALTAAGAAALAAASGTAAVELGYDRIYFVPGGVTVPAGVTLVGHGDGSVLLTNGTVPVLQPAGNGSSFYDFSIVGSQSGIPGANPNTQDGIANNYSGGYSEIHVSRVTFTSLTGCGIRHAATSATNGYGTHDCMLVTNCRFQLCAAGIFTDVRGEYLQATGCTMWQCYRGWWITGGNCSISGGRITGCTYGCQLEPGSNDSHGGMVGTLIDHCNVPILCNSISYGYKFEGISVFYGYIYLLGCQGVDFTGCSLDVQGWVLDVGTASTMTATGISCRFPGTVSASPVFQNNSGAAVNNTTCSLEFWHCKNGLGSTATTVGYAKNSYVPLESVSQPATQPSTGPSAALSLNDTGLGVRSWMGPYPGSPNAYDALYLGLQGNAPSGANYVLAANLTYVNYNVPTGGTHGFYANNATALLQMSASKGLQVSQPIVGDSSSSPYGVHGDYTFSFSTSTTIGATNFAKGFFLFTATAASLIVTFPLPAAGFAYQKCFVNQGANSFTLSVGSGVNASVAVSTAKQWFWFTSTGVY